MKLTEAQIRRIIREELLKEMDNMTPEKEEEFGAMDWAKSAAIGAGATAGIVGAERLLWYIQTHPEITKPLIDLLQAMGHSVQE